MFRDGKKISRNCQPIKKVIKNSGFNLIELLIVLAIVGILSAISFPIYSNYVEKTYRLEAAATLSKLAVAMEKYYIIHNSYENSTLQNLGFPEQIAGDRYQLVIASLSSDSYLLNAIPIGNQAVKDKSCGTLILNSLGEKNITGSGDWRDCW